MLIHSTLSAKIIIAGIIKSWLNFTFNLTVLKNLFQVQSLHYSMPMSFILSRCKEVCSGVAVMGCSSDNVDYYLSAIQGRVGKCRRSSVLYHPSWYPIKTCVLFTILWITAVPWKWIKEYFFLIWQLPLKCFVKSYLSTLRVK